MAKRIFKTDPASDIISGIEHRIELLTTLKAAVRFAFYGQAEPFDDVEDEQPTLTERRAHATAAKKPAKRRRRAAAMRPDGLRTAALLLDALGKWPGLTVNELYQYLDSRGWQSSSKNPKSVVYQALRNLLVKGQVQRTGTDWELVTAAAPTNTTEEVLGAGI